MDKVNIFRALEGLDWNCSTKMLNRLKYIFKLKLIVG